MLAKKKLLMTLKLDGVPRYFVKQVSRYRYSVPSTDGTGTGTKKSTSVQYRGTFVHGTAHLCLPITITNRYSDSYSNRK